MQARNASRQLASLMRCALESNPALQAELGQAARALTTAANAQGSGEAHQLLCVGCFGPDPDVSGAVGDKIRGRPISRLLALMGLTFVRIRVYERPGCCLWAFTHHLDTGR
jgi:hypothetical protein